MNVLVVIYININLISWITTQNAVSYSHDLSFHSNNHRALFFFVTDFICEEDGFFPHPRDCKKYFWCLDSGSSNLGIVAHQFTCPAGKTIPL